MQKLRQISISYEDLFIQRYGQMLNWSLQLTRHDRNQAEDLLHDAFIQFTLGRPDLDAIENLDGYLYGMLRNMRLSQVRKAARAPVGLFSLDYDSVEMSLRSIDARSQIQVQDEIREICRYACARKEISKVGSVLILRFFHGYYPTEIAQVLQSPRRAVDDWLRIARREARAYLDDPSRLNFLGDKAATRISRIGFGRATTDFLNDLRCAIYRSRQGECLPGKKLKALYGSSHTGPIDCAILAHIVSCPQCLDAVNNLLGLPPLSDWFPTDMLGPDSRSHGGDGRSAWPTGPSSAVLKKSIRDMEDVFQHRPKELRISVNGFILGSQKVSSELSEHTLAVNLDEKIGFVEVLSEQDVRLLFINVVPPPDGPVEQRARVELSEGRTLELNLNFCGPWPSIQSVYHDPLFRGVLLTKVHIVEEDAVAHLENAPVEEQLSSVLTLTRSFKSWLADWFAALAGLLRPGVVTALLAVLLISAVLLVRMRVTPVSAAELLDRASASEERDVARRDLVLHRSFDLEEREIGDGKPIVRRRVEVWLNGAQKVSARRVYDESGRLIAGEWTNADGARTLYHQENAPENEGKPKPQDKSQSGDGDMWLLDPSAKSFSKLIADVGSATVEETRSHYVIRHSGGGTLATGRLLEAALTLDRHTLHPIEQVLKVRLNAVDREFRFRESAYKRVPLETVSPRIFQPDPDIVGKTETRARPFTSRNEVAPADALVAPPALSATAIELEAVYQLHRVGGLFARAACIDANSRGRIADSGHRPDRRAKGRDIASPRTGHELFAGQGGSRNRI